MLGPVRTGYEVTVPLQPSLKKELDYSEWLVDLYVFLASLCGTKRKSVSFRTCWRCLTVLRRRLLRWREREAF